MEKIKNLKKGKLEEKFESFNIGRKILSFPDLNEK